MTRTKASNVVSLPETDEMIDKRIRERFDVMNELADACIQGEARALIVSGAPGHGKSYTITKALESADVPHTIVRGYSRATGLYKTLYTYRHPGNVVVFDDCDSVFNDDTTLNLIKAVADTSERRVVSWLSETKFIDEDTGEIVPRSFEFEGTIIFLSNLNFDAIIDRGHKIAPHLEALMSRAHYIDLTLHTPRDAIIRIRQVVEEGMLSDMDIEAQADVLTFIEAFHSRMRELSLRSVIKVANLRKSKPCTWEKMCRITLLRG
jgi:hypothetical protein